MDILRFTLSGRTAFFKKPDLNTYYYFTFGNIHKIALLGIFGAILGLKGYSENYSKDEYPEFYKQLNDIQYSIVPRNHAGFIRKKFQQFNNSVGYASKELGGNLIVKEQWLENPIWDIYVILDKDIALRLSDSIINKKCYYIPYLGKNDHPANISNAVILNNCNVANNYITIDSLFLKNKVEYADLDDFEEENPDVKLFKYEETLPVGLDEITHMYYYETFVNTNHPIRKYNDDVFEVAGKHIVFY